MFKKFLKYVLTIMAFSFVSQMAAKATDEFVMDNIKLGTVKMLFIDTLSPHRG